MEAEAEVAPNAEEREVVKRVAVAIEVVVMATVEGDMRLACTTPAPRCGPGACNEVVEVSLNSESYSSSGVGFTYHNATVSAVSVVSRVSAVSRGYLVRVSS